MSFKSKALLDEPVTPSRPARPWEEEDETGTWLPKKAKGTEQDGSQRPGEIPFTGEPASNSSPSPKMRPRSLQNWPAMKRGHALSFAGLLLFTSVTYFRPYELIPALAGFTSMAYWLAVATLLVFIPTQLSLEGTLTARPREVNLILLLLLCALLSVPLAIQRSEAWAGFVEFAKVITMFVVMINVVRTELRLRAMLWLAFLVSVVLSVHALYDYRLGNLTLSGVRIKGFIGGMFENPNDMALHLVTMIPLALGLLFVARGLVKKILYSFCVLFMVAATVVTFSRGGFLALICALFVMAWKLGRRHRTTVVVLFLGVVLALLAIAPSALMGRLSSVYDGSAVDFGSAAARQNLLVKSIEVSVRHPILGVGVNNFYIVSIRDQVTHNAYTQVSSEMGMAALIIYLMFMWAALKRLRGIERDTSASRAQARVYYLAVGLQASIVGYMVASFFSSVAYLWYIYFIVGYAVCLHRIYDAEGATGPFFRAVNSGRLAAVEAKSEVPVAAFAAPLTARRKQ